MFSSRGRTDADAAGRARWARVALVAGVVVATAGATTVNNSAIAVPATATRSAIGFIPSIHAHPNSASACTTSCVNVTFHGGPVQHAEKDYLIFWTPPGYYMPPAYRSGLITWMSDVAAAAYTPGNVFSVAQQYYDLSGPGGAKSFVPYAVTYGGSFVDKAALPASGCTDSATPACIDDSQIRAEVQKIVTMHALPQNDNTEYILFTPFNVGSCFSGPACAYTQYCGYHNYFAGPSGNIVYANMPWAYNTNGCDANLAFNTGLPNGDAIDQEVGLLSKELIAMMTDPHLNAWFDSAGNEIGDKCAYNYNGTTYGSTSGLSNNGLGYWNQLIHGDEYLMQTEYSNFNSDGTTTGCVGRNTDTQPTVTITLSPNPPVHGSSATFTAKVTDPAGVNSVQWSFGDGGTATGNPVHHTYATAGSKTLTVIVTDAHGNEKRVVQSVAVS
jgi:PKD domain-containing protein